MIACAIVCEYECEGGNECGTVYENCYEMNDVTAALLHPPLLRNRLTPMSVVDLCEGRANQSEV